MSTITPEKTAAESAVFPVAGILAVDDNNAYVRVSGYAPGPDDVQVPLAMVRKYRLRAGDDVLGTARLPRNGGTRNGRSRPVLVTAPTMPDRPAFNDLTPVNPHERLTLGPDPVGRIIDLVTPIGKGQRGLVVAPPKAGKTMILQSLARSIAANHPECHLMLLLIDERPEEVTDLRKSVPGAEVVWSTFDRPPGEHIAVADLAVERAKRLAEQGRDVVILLDSLTRLGRAHNLAAPGSSRILAGGVAASALYPPKKFFGAARNLEEAGSLTIIATALVETGSRMDEVFFEEFKGTGNMELRLSRKLAERRLFPAIDLAASSTRRDELIVPADELARTWRLRSMLAALDDTQALELLLAKVKETRTNTAFLAELP
ncbi:transcription termination factor Rho [Actinocorallia longicatena]|uniref:Transcription termination factor Rho n=1 Tax=Actinocorallia longicatena TaxID=111803 RepID=A0ABP6QN86_9ACTN